MSIKTEEFSLNFNTFDEHVTTSWKQLQFEEAFYDATLACEDKQIQINKSIISCCSPVLRNIFLHSTGSPFIYLKGVAFEDVQNLINFIHQGEVNIAESGVGSFLSLCEELKVVGLWENDGNLHTSLTSPNKSSEVASKINTEGLENEQDLRRKHDSDFIQDKKLINNTKVRENFEEIDLQQELETENNREEIIKQLLKDQKSLLPLNDKEVISKTAFICKTCGEGFLHQTYLEIHINQVHKEIKYSCEQCNYKTADPYILKQHLASLHKKMRYSCKQCDFKGTTLGNIKRHQNSMHDGIRFKCSQCDYQATFKGLLKKHMKQH